MLVTTPPWSGDVWKSIVHLRSIRPDLRVAVLDCDSGVGIRVIERLDLRRRVRQ